MSQLDHIAYDGIAREQQSVLKKRLDETIEIIERNLNRTRSRSLALTKLEEAYMWIGKAIRDDQLTRMGCGIESDAPFGRAPEEA